MAEKVEMCKLCGVDREEMLVATQNKELPILFCMNCDGMIPPDLEASLMEDDEEAVG